MGDQDREKVWEFHNTMRRLQVGADARLDLFTSPELEELRTYTMPGSEMRQLIDNVLTRRVQQDPKVADELWPIRSRA